MERVYNKLVRDKIPEVILRSGETPVTRILDETEYKKELEKKLYEECNEVIEACGADRVEELADMLEVIRALAKTEGVSLQELLTLAENKTAGRGAFDDRIFLEKVIPSK